MLIFPLHIFSRLSVRFNLKLESYLDGHSTRSRYELQEALGQTLEMSWYLAALHDKRQFVYR